MNDYLKKKKMNWFKILLMCTILLSSHVFAQAQTITGFVRDTQNEPITGASVSVKGTTTGTLTDLDGKYSISANPKSTLVISFIGYQSQELVVGSKTVIDVTLQESNQTLDEVVVTALGMSREKKALGYAVTEISGSEISKSNLSNPINGLQGKVAGVQINMGNSGPQSSNRILIRGNSSLGTNNQPIFVIDGIIIDNTVTKSAEWEAQQDFGNDIKNLNSDDFESVSILKGAAASALYGSRAANGVVLITTKKGRKGSGFGVSVSQSMSWDDVYKYPKFQNEFGPGENPVWGLNADGTENRNAGTTTQNFGPAFDGLPYLQGGQEWLYKAQKDNVKKMYQTGNYMNTNVAIQGGTDKSAFRFSYSRLQSEGVTLNNDYKRNSFSLNASHDISSRLKAEVGVSWVHSDVKNPTFQGGGRSPIYDFMYQVPRTYDTSYWLNNYISPKGDGASKEDPIKYTKTIYEYLQNNRSQREDNIRGNAKLDVKLTDWLSLKLMGDFFKLNSTQENKIMATGTENYDGAAYGIFKKEKEQYKITAMLSASHRFGDIGASGSVAVEQWDTRTSYFENETSGGLQVPGLFLISNSVNAPTIKTLRNTDRKRINSIYAFANLDWKNQVYLDITGRNDWSSALMYPDGSGNVSYFYPSVGASWLITESFRDELPSAISFAKIRASYAVVGNDCSPYLTNLGFYKANDGTPSYTSPFGGSYPWYVFDSKEMRNLDLKPEKQHSIELGAEMRFFNNRLGFDFTWYKTNTKNQILSLDLPRETGMVKRWINAGNIQNSGIELALNFTPIQTKDWNWDVNFNITHNKNKIIELIEGLDKYKIEGGGMDLAAYATVGGAYGDIYTAYTFARNEAGEKLLGPSGNWLRSGKEEKVGSIQPKLLAGFSTSLTYKSINLGVVMDARFGGDIASGSFNYGSYSGALKSTLAGRTAEYGGLPRTMDDGRVVHDGMIPDGVFQDNTTINGVNVSGMSYQEAYDKGIVQPVSAYNYYNNLYSWGTGIREATIKKVSWIALREISIRWNLPQKWTSKAYMENVSVGFVARNLGYLYNSLPDDIHPEGLASNRSSDFVERGGTPYTRTLGFNINVSF